MARSRTLGIATEVAVRARKLRRQAQTACANARTEHPVSPRRLSCSGAEARNAREHRIKYQPVRAVRRKGRRRFWAVWIERGGGTPADLTRREAGKDYGSGTSQSGSSSASSGGGMASNAADSLRDVASRMSETAGEAYEQGSRYVRDASDHLPEVDEYAEAVRRPIEQNPIVSALIVGAIGYLAAYLIHGGGFGSQHRPADYYSRDRASRVRRNRGF
jgi:hypothetical protein